MRLFQRKRFDPVLEKALYAMAEAYLNGASDLTAWSVANRALIEAGRDPSPNPYLGDLSGKVSRTKK